jgi:GT2 family glycosyltransferase
VNTPFQAPISVAIPTYGRDAVLTDTITELLDQLPAAAEVLVIDQTPHHDAETEALLSAWHAAGRIRWERLTKPSQPAALNHALRISTQPYVLMLDDDIRIGPGFVAAHMAGFVDDSVWAVVGQVLQPGEVPLEGVKHAQSNSPLADLDFPFSSADPAWIANGMSGNMTVRRDRAIGLGAFDENFIPPVAYRFDTEFCKRLIRAGGRIRFEPEARIDHLRASRGGTRTTGSHLTSASPIHGVGDYYFAFRQGMSAPIIFYVLRRPLREICTRFHLRHPWWIPVKLLGEFRALLKAAWLHWKGPDLAFSSDESGPDRLKHSA